MTCVSSMPSSKLEAAEDKLNQELENAHGEYPVTKAVLERKIQLYNRYQVENHITEVERLMISNKREWQMAHLLGLIEHQAKGRRPINEWCWEFQAAAYLDVIIIMSVAIKILFGFYKI